MAEDTPLPLMKHLEELRKRLARSLIALLLGFAFCFYHAPALFDFLIQPAILAQQQGQAEQVLKALPPEVSGGLPSRARESLKQAIVEVLREGPTSAAPGLVLGRLPEPTRAALTPAQVEALEARTPDVVRHSLNPPHLVFTGMSESFFTQLKVAFFAALLLVLPYVLWQIWSFVAPGLYKTERMLLLPVVAWSTVLFVAGGAFCFYVVFPTAFAFFLSAPYVSDLIAPMLTTREYLSFITRFILAFGLIFQMPLLAYFLSRIGVVTARGLTKGRRYALIANFVIAAILTPTPDMVNQLLMAGPLIVLYEVSIVIARVFGRKPEAEAAAG